MKKFFLFLILFILIICSVSAEESSGFALDDNRYNISVTPIILENGVQNDIIFGIFYTDAMKTAGEFRVRAVKETVSDKVWGIRDSLMTRESQVTEFFFLPFSYHFVRTSNFSFQAGIGVYFEHNRLIENGYFNDKDFSGEDRYSSYNNDYTGYSAGPLIDIGFSYKASFFKCALSFGIVPVFYLDRNQTWKLLPMMNPEPVYKVNSESTCGPYYYLSFDIAINLKYFVLLFSLLNEYSDLNYTAAGFNDSTGKWADVKEKMKYTKLALEASVLFNLGTSGLMPQIGYGRIIDDVTGGENYLVLGVKKEWF